MEKEILLKLVNRLTEEVTKLKVELCEKEVIIDQVRQEIESLKGGLHHDMESEQVSADQ